nr:hypothetical protein AUG91_09660 [uncultured bacterium]
MLGERLSRREERRRRMRRRRAIGLAILVVLAAAAIGVAIVSAGRTSATRPPVAKAPERTAPQPKREESRHVAPPKEIRGVHVPVGDGGGGRLEGYIALKRLGLNTIELDVKNEDGRIGFLARVPLARSSGARGSTTSLGRPPRASTAPGST